MAKFRNKYFDFKEHSSLLLSWFRRTFWFGKKETNHCHQARFLRSKYTKQLLLLRFHPDTYFGMQPISHPRPTQPSILPGSVNEYQLLLGRQMVWFSPLADERGCAGKTVRSLENTCHTWAPSRQGDTNPRLPFTLPNPAWEAYSGLSESRPLAEFGNCVCKCSRPTVYSVYSKRSWAKFQTKLL